MLYDFARPDCKLRLLERHAEVGGKIRTIPSEAGLIDAGPTVLTMRQVFDDLFKLCGRKISMIM